MGCTIDRPKSKDDEQTLVDLEENLNYNQVKIEDLDL